MADISVLLCAYKEPPDQFDLAVRSVVTQTVVPKQLVVVDDSGELRYRDLCEDIKRSMLVHQGITLVYIGNKSNLGLVHSLNLGLREVATEYVARMDADDVSLPFRFQKQAELLDAGYDLVGSGVTLFTASGQVRDIMYPSSRIGVLYSFIRNNPIAHPAAMFRKNMVDRLHGYRSVDYAEDLDLWMRAYLSGCRITNSRSILLLRRIHEDQLSSKYTHVQASNAKTLRRNFLRALFTA